MTRRLALLVWLWPGAAAAAAFGSAGSAGADFAKIIIAPRASAMGGAGSALGQDLGALDLNPAALAGQGGAQAEAAHVSWLEGVALDRVALGWGRKDGWALGLSYLQLGTPAIPSYDAGGLALGTFKQQDRSATLSGALPLGRVDLGLSARLLQRELAGLAQSGYEGDVGVRLRLGSGWSLGLAAQHLGALAALEQEADPTPMTLRGGFAWARPLGRDFEGALALDGVQPYDSAVQVRAGAELRLYGLLALRAGSQFSEAFDGRQAFTAGAGLQWQGLGLDYAWAPFGVLGNSHRFGLSWNAAARRAAQAKAKPRPRARWLEAKREGAGVLLSWDGSASERWTVYLKKGAREELSKVGVVSGSAAKVRLKKVVPNADVVFAVAPLDPELGEGERSHLLTLPPARASLRALAPPLAPRRVRIERDADGARLAWDAPEGAEGRLLYQAYTSSRGDDGFTPLGGLNSLQERRLDLGAFKRRQAFAVRAREAGADAPLSDWSETVVLEP